MCYLFCRADRELTDAYLLVAFVCQEAFGHQTHLASLGGCAVDNLFNRIGLDVGKLAFRHLLPIDKELVVGDMPGGISPLVRRITEAGDGLGLCQLYGQLRFSLRQQESGIAVAIQDQAASRVFRRNDVIERGRNVKLFHGYRTALLERRIVGNRLHDALLGEVERCGVACGCGCRFGAICRVIDLSTLVACHDVDLITQVARKGWLCHQGRCQESLHIVDAERASGIGEMDADLICLLRLEPHDALIAYRCGRVHRLRGCPLAIIPNLDMEGTYTLA